MVDNFNLSQKIWWHYLDEDLRELLNESVLLLTIFENETSGVTAQIKRSFHDYSFVIFPSAKAYEGFLKKIFFDLQFISHDDYYGSRFRIGRALNPSLEEKYAYDSVYRKIVDYTQGKKLADQLWVTWKNCRNLVFHWFPDEKKVISLEEANLRVKDIIDAIEEAYAQLKK